MINKGYFRSRGIEVEHRGSIRHGRTEAQTAEILRNEGRVVAVEAKRAAARQERLMAALRARALLYSPAATEADDKEPITGEG